MNRCERSCVGCAPLAGSRRAPSSVTVRAAPSTSRPPAPPCDRWPNESSCSTPRSTATTELSASSSTPPPPTHRRTQYRLRHRSAVPRLVSSRPLSQRSRLRPPRRHFTGPRHLRPEPDPSPPQPWRRPPPQPRAPPRRRHQTALRPHHPRLHRPPSRRRQDRTRSHPLHETLPRPPRLATARAPENHYLTDIEASAGAASDRATCTGTAIGGRTRSTTRSAAGQHHSRAETSPTGSCAATR
jgi:hypothetical protein